MPESELTPLNAATRYCAVLGHPIKHSASPAMQNAGIAALGRNWRYLAFDVHPDNLRAAISGAKALKYVGLNLTVPHKLLAVAMVDILHDSAKTWGAVNTIAFEALDGHGAWRPVGSFDGDVPDNIRSIGYNTDADAITSSLQEDLRINVDGARVLLLGAGGAGRTAALKLATAKVSELFLVNRTQSKAEEVANEIRQRFPQVQVSLRYPAGKVDLLLNATSLGLRSDDVSPLDAIQFSIGQADAVYDMIYRPPETTLLKTARAAGCRTANGFGMLLHQGAGALAIWSGHKAPVGAMRTALQKELYGN